MDTIDFDLRECLRETIILLGGPKHIADLLIKSQDGSVSQADVEKLRQYNIDLFALAKARIHNLTTIKLKKDEI